MTEKQYLLAYDRKRTSTLTLDSEPGAHTGATRQYIPGYSDSNIVYLDTVSGNDSNDGSTELLAKQTYASAATAAGTTKKIRVINDGAALSTNITKPTEMKRGVSGTISSSLTAPVNTWTQAGTPSFSSDTIFDICWANHLNKFVAVGSGGKIGFSSDGDAWTQAATPALTGSITAIAYSRSLRILVAGVSNGYGSDAIAYSSDGNIWTQVTGEAYFGGNINKIIWADSLGKFIAAGSVGTTGNIKRLAVSDDGATWVQREISEFPAENIESLAWSESLGLLVAVTDNINGYGIAYSSDLIIWQVVNSQPFSDYALDVLWADGIGKFIAVGRDGEIATSSNGTTWTLAATPAFSSGNINAIAYSPELGSLVAVGHSGQVAYSSDGNTWTLAATPSFSSSAIFSIAYSPELGRFAAGAVSGKLARSTAFANTISASIAGFTVQAVQYSGTVTAYNCTMKQPGTTASLSLNGCRITEPGSHISSNTATSFATLFEGDRHTTCTPAAQNDIDCNLDTVGGTWYIYNASATGFERVRDCLVTNGIIANFNVTVSGRANIQGESENILIDAEVTLDDPKFVDTTDYKLQFQTNGYPRNSLAAGRSAIYFNSAGDPRDIGAWSYVESAVSYFFAKSAVLYKGEITHGVERVTTEQQGDSGGITVFGNKNRVKEILTINYGPTQEFERAPFEYLDTIDDKGVKVVIDAEWESNAGSVTVNGNQSAGAEFLTVDSTTYFNGMWVTASGKRYWIMRASPSNTAATKLILDRAIEDAVSDNDILTTNYPPGMGEFQYSGIQQIQLKRVAPDGLTGWQTGFQVRFVRKKS